MRPAARSVSLVSLLFSSLSVLSISPGSQSLSLLSVLWVLGDDGDPHRSGGVTPPLGWGYLDESLLVLSLSGGARCGPLGWVSSLWGAPLRVSPCSLSLSLCLVICLSVSLSLSRYIGRGSLGWGAARSGGVRPAESPPVLSLSSLLVSCLSLISPCFLSLSSLSSPGSLVSLLVPCLSLLSVASSASLRLPRTPATPRLIRSPLASEA